MSGMRSDHGATAVEFALVLPLVLGFVGMALTGGLAFTYDALVHRGAEYAAREAAVPEGLYASSYATEEEVTAAAATGTVLFEPTSVTVVCSPSPCGEGRRVTVRVSYDWANPAAGLLSAVTGGGVGDSFVFTGQARRVVE